MNHYTRGFPRPRGDEPAAAPTPFTFGMFSPPARG